MIVWDVVVVRECLSTLECGSPKGEWRLQKGETGEGSKCYWLERWRWEKTKGGLVTDEVLQGKLPP